MKYNIFRYNQRKSIQKGLDLKDLCILEWIQDFWPKMTKMIIDNEEYGWINYDYLIKDIPIVEINTNDGLYRRLKQMVEIGILKHKGVKNEKGSFSYYKITEMILELFDDAYSFGGTDEKSDGGADRKPDGTDEKSERVRMKSRNKDNPSNNPSTISSSSLPTLEEAKKFCEEEELNIDVKNWLDNSKDEEIRNWKKAIKAWAKLPKNQLQKKTSDSIEILEIRRIIENACNDRIAYINLFGGCKIENRTVFVTDKRAMSYKELLADKNIKIELK